MTDELSTPVTGRAIILHPSDSLVSELSLAFLRQGLLPIRAFSGNHCRELTHHHRPEVVIVDVGVDDIFCFDLIPILRGLEKSHKAKIVLTSAGESRVVFRREGADLFGADVFIEPEELLERQSEYIGVRIVRQEQQGRPKPPKAHSNEDLLELLAYDVILTHHRDLEYWPGGAIERGELPELVEVSCHDWTSWLDEQTLAGDRTSLTEIRGRVLSKLSAT